MRVVAIYAVTAWLVLQVAEVTVGPLELPPWIMKSLVIGAIAGFPISFLLAWVIDIHRGGLIFDLPLWVGDRDNPRPQKKTDLIYAAVLALLLAGGTYSTAVLLFDDEPAIVITTETPPNSIAVLAFDNFDGHSETDYFAAGLAEEILNLLAAMRELNVAARSSSFRFRGEQVDVRDVSRILSVRHVLEGSVRRDGDRIRVAAQLIDGDNGYLSWNESYDRELDDIFAIQKEIAAAVVSELKIALSVDSEQLLQGQPTENIDAYVYYLQGRERLRSSLDADVMITADELFQKAIEIDPGFSRAYAGICEVHLRLYDIGNDTNDFQTAETACGEAGQLDPGLNSDIHLALGKLYRYRGWYEQAEAQLNDAIAISPMAADAYIELGKIRMAQNRLNDAEASYLRAVDLKRNYWKAHMELASYYYRTERYADAARAYEIATSLAPDVASAFGGKGAAYWMLGESEKAREAYDRSLELKPSRQAYTNMGSRYYYAGQFNDAVESQLKALEYAPDDHRVWGRLAESYRFVPGGEEESLRAYERAAELAEENLAINENDWETMGLLGLYYSHLNRAEEARNLVSRSVSMSKRASEALYYQALSRLKLGDQNGALDSLEEAVLSDEQYAQFIVSDPDLQLLRNSERLRGLLPEAGD